MGRNNPSIGARKRFRHTRNEQINRSVHEWYQQQSATGLRITGPMLQKQARHYAAHLGIMNFAASNGWLANFRRFYNIISVSTHLRRISTPLFCQGQSKLFVSFESLTFFLLHNQQERPVFLICKMVTYKSFFFLTWTTVFSVLRIHGNERQLYLYQKTETMLIRKQALQNIKLTMPSLYTLDVMKLAKDLHNSRLRSQPKKIHY